MNNKETVCAVVVTYNRKELLLECLEALKKQSWALDAIYLIDNASTDGTPELLVKNNYIKELPNYDLNKNWERTLAIKNLTDRNDLKLHYVRMHENTGGAGGFHEGVKRAYKKGYDWLWIMDDDAEPKDDALDQLSKYFKEDDVSALANLQINDNGTILYDQRGFSDFFNIPNHMIKPIETKSIEENEYLEIDHASFVGILINRRAIDKIGFPKKELFIQGDDVEYCIRLRRVGKILLISNSIIIHKEKRYKQSIEKPFFGKTFFRIKYENLWLTYYETRNVVWLMKLYRRPYLFLIFTVIRMWLISVLGIILLDNKKLRRIYFVTSAYIDGIKGNFDNKKPKKILYG